MMETVGSAGGGGWRMNENGALPVDCQTLREFMDKEKIDYADLIKMDVESHELDIVKANLFPVERIGRIIGELHYFGDKVKRKEFKDTMEWLGFNFKMANENLFLAPRGMGGSVSDAFRLCRRYCAQETTPPARFRT